MSLIKGYKPHDNQRLIHAAINQGKEKYFALNIGRQFGKTLLGINLKSHNIISGSNLHK